MFVLDLKSRTPIYEQLKNKTIELVISGVIEEDSKLPSVRELARQLGINPNTIQKAYQDMEKDGIIYSISGKGSFISNVSNIKQRYKDKMLVEFQKNLQDMKKNGMSKDEIINYIESFFEKENDK